MMIIMALIRAEFCFNPVYLRTVDYVRRDIFSVIIGGPFGKILSSGYIHGFMDPSTKEDFENNLRRRGLGPSFE